ISGTYSYEHHRIDDSWPDWPQEFGGYGGSMSRKPQSFMVNLISTLRPTLLNEFRFGLTRPQAYTENPIEGPNGDAIREIVRQLLPTGSGSQYFGGTKAQDLDILFSPGEGLSAFHNDATYVSAAETSHPYGGGYIRDSWGGWDPRWTIADTMTWLKGSHAFKAGVEYRRQTSNQDATGSHMGPGTGGGALTAYPLIFGGAITAVTERRKGMLGRYAPNGALDDGVSWRRLPAGAQDDGVTDPLGAVYTTPYAMMTYFSGAVRNSRQYFFQIPDASHPSGARWNELALGETLDRISVKNQEIHFFFKDDWKVTGDLTLNLGIRYEYYGVPYVLGGRTLGLVGGGTRGVFGISEPSFDNWMKNRTYVKTAPGVVPEPVTAYQYIGPGSENPDIMPWKRDLNNFAPHLGFSWQLPWFGKGQTVLRGGWSVSYGQVNTFDQYAATLAVSSGAVPSYTANYGGHGDRFDIGNSAYYMDLTDLSGILPLSGDLVQEQWDIVPMRPFPVGRFSGTTVSAHDDNVRNPYTHNFNMSLTRSIGRSLTLDVRYIGTMGRDQIQSPSMFSLNQGNFIDNNLQKEFAIVRAGGQSPVINSIIPTGALVSSLFAPEATGSDQLRHAFSPTLSNLAAGNFSGLVGSSGWFGPSGLAVENGALGATFPGEMGRLSRAGCLPEDRQGYLAAFEANPNTLVQLDDQTFPCAYGTPWNYFFTNPQHAGIAYTYNATLTNYHSMQVQATMRPTRGLSFQATYTWSRNLSNTGWTNYIADRDYVLSGQHRTHSLNTYGSYELPFGANGFFFRDASGTFRKAIEGWQVSWITSMSSGQPISATGTSTMWGNNFPVLVRPDLWDEKSGQTTETWDNGRFVGGRYFGDRYAKVLDRGICDVNAMDGGLYDQYCESMGIMRFGAPRALALASGERAPNGDLLPVLYDRDYTAADGVTYRAGDPVIVFRNANQLDYNGSQYIGNYKNARVTGPGYFSFDMAMSKSIEFMEGKRFELRVDAKNILNHATPTDLMYGFLPISGSYGGRFMPITQPGLGINSTAVFGNLPTKAGHRTFQARLRLSF
ncbi:MAG: TonB-dependent receptor, partial [Acidobacteria bacterium]|nr:TonB-dependent receptor [Acidobacteriota bacterium]